MRAPHESSRPFAIDPAYSAESTLPGITGNSLFEPPVAGDAAWIYAWGDLEGWLLARMRAEAMEVCHNVFHPGSFPRFHPLVQFQKKIPSRPLPDDCTVTIWNSGDVHFSSGNLRIARVAGTGRPARNTVDLRPLMRENTEFNLNVVLTRTDAPPALLIESGWLRTDAAWHCSASLSFKDLTGPVAAFARGDLSVFPHDVRLPVMTLEAARTEDGCHDFGVNLLARPVVEIPGGTGSARIFPGESIAEAQNRDERYFEQTPQEIVASGPGTYSTRAELAFRYLRIEGDAAVAKATAEASLYPARYCGAFASSDELLTRVWMHSAYTLRLCMRELYIDGPKRDRLPWVGDVFIGALGNSVTFADAGIVRRTLVALFPDDVRRQDCNGILDYSLYWILTLDRYLMFTGDLEFTRNLWAQAKELLAALETREDGRGLLSSDKAEWVFIDWADIDKQGTCAALQMLHILALDAAAEIGRELRDDAAASAFANKAARLRRLVRKTFWSADRGRFADGAANGEMSGRAGRHANFFALLAGLANRRQTAQILGGVLLGNETPGVGTPYMRYFESAALCRAGRAGAMLERLRAYWGGMLDLGATTFWEGYNPLDQGAQHSAFYGRPFAKSLCHAWASGPLQLLSADLVGLTPTAPGWRRFTVQLPKIGLPWICASVPTPHGDIRWEIEGRRGKIVTPDGKQTDLRGPGPAAFEIG